MMKFRDPSAVRNGKMPRLLGVGSPLLDMLVPVDEAFLDTIPGEKGGMMMVDAAFQRDVLGRLPAKPRFVPGGSAGNTVFALARLGMPVAMFGKLGDDEYGAYYRARLAELGGSVAEFRSTSEQPTGSCLAMITPDGERTMRSNLAASLLLREEEVEEIDFSRYDLVYIEGYMLYSPVVRRLLRRAREAGCSAGLDLASFEVVRDFRSELPELLRDFIDIVLANEDEADRLLPGMTPERQVERLSDWCSVAAVKLGRDGALVREGSRTARVPAELVESPVDTTAAGDLWAAGFLYGLAQGRTAEEAARFGAVTGGEVVKVVGSEIPDERWEYIRSRLK